MKPDMFKTPVTIFVGLGFPTDVCCVMEAYRHLVEWPASNRDALHRAALNACGAALRGEIEAETADCLQPLRKSTICLRQRPLCQRQ